MFAHRKQLEERIRSVERRLSDLSLHEVNRGEPNDELIESLAGGIAIACGSGEVSEAAECLKTLAEVERITGEPLFSALFRRRESSE